ncbi:MAG: protein kinase [Planctomycetes bacterium]|nr:protein kinase [Planctomycetota bacterium]
MIGQVIDQYRITAKLGEGGMGVVYRATHTSLQREVAIKSLDLAASADPKLRQRFINEATVLSRLHHPNIVALYNFIEDEASTQCFIVMELVDGTTVDGLIEELGLIPPRRAVPILVQVLSAIGKAHGAGVIHRDLKPANILIGPQDVAKVTDFGTAKMRGGEALTRAGMTIGTPIYMSPEQLRGKDLTPASDLYSLGVTLYEMVTGKLPYYDESNLELMKKIDAGTPTRPSEHYPPIPAALEEVTLRAIAKDPSERFQSAEEFREALVALLESEEVGEEDTAELDEMDESDEVEVPALEDDGGGRTWPWVLAAAVVLGVAVLLTMAVDWQVGSGVAVAGGATVALAWWVMRARTSGADVEEREFEEGDAGEQRTCPDCGRVMMPEWEDCRFCRSRDAGRPASAPRTREPGAVQLQTVPPTGELPAARPEGRVRRTEFMDVAAARPTTGPITEVAILVSRGPDQGQRFVLGGVGGVIGRKKSCAVRLNDLKVSNSHARIAIDGGIATVVDMESRNGLHVNGRRVAKAVLSSGDILGLGDTHLRVELG